MREILHVLFTVGCWVTVIHVVLLMVCSRWHQRNADLVYDDYDQYILRMALPPWYVRYAHWVIRSPLPAPSEWVLDKPDPRDRPHKR